MAQLNGLYIMIRNALEKEDIKIDSTNSTINTTTTLKHGNGWVYYELTGDDKSITVNNPTNGPMEIKLTGHETEKQSIQQSMCFCAARSTSQFTLTFTDSMAITVSQAFGPGEAVRCGEGTE